MEKALKTFVEDTLNTKIMTLHEAVQSNDSFIYDRSVGAFWVEGSAHVLVLSKLYSIHLGADTWSSHEQADRFMLEIPGICFRSSISKIVTAGKPENLSRTEKRIIGHDSIMYIEK
jgi:hypothetical protein